MTNRWHFDITVTQAENLERNCIRNICFVTRSTHTTYVFDMFSGAWGSFNLKIEIHELNTTKFSLGLLKSSGVLKGIRIGKSLNRDYTFSFSMKLSPQQLVYDQDANRSRGFNTNVGGLLEFHC